MERRSEAYLDEVLKQSGPEQLDYVDLSIKTESILGEDSSDQGALIDSLRHKRNGNQVDGVGQYMPGTDAVHNLDVRASYASDMPMARKVIDQTAPARMHVVLDQPERFTELSGTYAAEKLGSFALSLCGRISEVAGTELAVYQNDGESAGLLYEGYAHELYDAYNQMEGKIDRRLIEETGSTALSGLLKLVGENIDHDNDALMVVSDFLDEYDAENDEFKWDTQLRYLHGELDDRLWAVRIASPAQTAYPELINTGMSHDVIAAMNRDFADLAVKKQEALEKALNPLEMQNNSRYLSVNTLREANDTHPAIALSRFVLGDAA